MYSQNNLFAYLMFMFLKYIIERKHIKIIPQKNVYKEGYRHDQINKYCILVLRCFTMWFNFKIIILFALYI